MNCITQMNDPAKINPTLNQKNKTKIVSQNEIYSQEKIQSRLKLEIIGSRLDPSQSLSLQGGQGLKHSTLWFQKTNSSLHRQHSG